MIGFAVSFFTWVAVTFSPALLGLILIVWVGKKLNPRYTLAFAFGILFWFFVDTISGSAVLDVNSGFGGGVAQIEVVALFASGMLFFFWVDRNRNILSPQSAVGKYGMTISVLVAIAVGIHGLGEGAAYGATAFVTTSPSLLEAFGGLSTGVAYILHKGLEPMMIGACYTVYSRKERLPMARVLQDLFQLALIFVIPSVVGVATGYFLPHDATPPYFFALGTGTSIYAIFRLAGPLFAPATIGSSNETIKTALSWLFGIIAIYIAALFHS